MPPTIFFPSQNSSLLIVALSPNSFTVYDVSHDTGGFCSYTGENRSYVFNTYINFTALNQKNQSSHTMHVEIKVIYEMKIEQLSEGAMLGLICGAVVLLAVAYVVMRVRKRREMK